MEIGVHQIEIGVQHIKCFRDECVQLWDELRQEGGATAC